MKKNKKRLILISGLVIILCIVGYFVGSSFISKANTRIIASSTQGYSDVDQVSQEETDALKTEVLETEALEIEEVSTESEIETSNEAETTVSQTTVSPTTAPKKSLTALTISTTPTITKAPPAKPLQPVRVRVVSSEVIPYDGLQRSITCWGDSLTEGTGSGPYYPILTNIKVKGVSTDVNGETMPSTLGELTKLHIYNMGVYGEDSRTIACRQGGLKMYVSDITIPTRGSVEISQIICEDGMLAEPNINGSEGERACFDACSIGGIIGTLSYDWETELYMFTRTQPGSELVVSTETQIITPPSIDRVGDILILQMGNNGGFNDDYNVLIAQYDAMIEYNQCKYYIIVGDTDYGADDRAEWENALQQAYGDHFINMRQYLVDFVNDGKLNDLGIPENPDEFEQLENGEVPYSLKVGDESHMNSYGYWIEGNAIYEKGCELGYWGY